MQLIASLRINDCFIAPVVECVLLVIIHIVSEKTNKMFHCSTNANGIAISSAGPTKLNETNVPNETPATSATNSTFL